MPQVYDPQRSQGELNGFWRSHPKIEAHLHLDGALRPRLIKELAQAQSHPLGQMSLQEIARTAVVDSPLGSLAEVLRAFDAICPLLRAPQALERVSYEICRQAAASHTFYFEVRYAPFLSATENFTVEEAIGAILSGLERGREEWGVGSGLIVTLLRNLPRQANEKMFAAALRFRNSGVVAIDLAQDESRAPLKNFADLFQEAKRQGLGTVVHAGEVYPSPDFKTILELGINRIGHGVFLPRYPDLFQEAARRKIPIEVNLTSNLRTNAVSRYQDHPLRRFVEAGLPVVLGTDDPGVFGIDLPHEYAIAERELGFSRQELKRLATAAADTLFLAPKEKESLKRRLQESDQQ